MGCIKSFTLIKGSDIEIIVDLVNKATRQPVALDGFEGATGYFAKEGSWYAASGGLHSSDRGQVKLVIPRADSATIDAMPDGADIEVQVDKSGKRIIAQILGSVMIVDSLIG